MTTNTTQKIKRFLINKIVIATFLIVAALIIIGKKIHYLAAAPLGEKNCPPLFPETMGEPNPEKTAINKTLGLQLPWTQQGGSINDASCLNKTYVHGIVSVQNENDIIDALAYANEHDLSVSMAGVKHSMGGHAFYKNAMVLDMTKFNHMELDEETRVLTVQSGATWHDIQNFLHPKFAVKAMQSSDIFTVGGSISVNAHGMDHQAGSVGQSLQSMRVLLADGSIEEVSREQNAELFNLIVGGYGLFGIVLDAKIEITDNAIYESKRNVIDYTEFPEFFANTIQAEPKIGLFYAHLSTAPGSLLREAIIYTYHEQEKTDDLAIGTLEDVGTVGLRRFMLNFSKLGSFPRQIKWFAEKHIEPMIESCTVIPRGEAMKHGESCMVSRNDPMHDSVPYLYNNLKNDTDILHEYFIPRDQFVSFVDGLREIIATQNINLLNASVRVAHQGENFLTYSPEDTFSLVLYINQTTDAAGNEKMKQATQAMIDLAVAHNGRFFLPYQLHYTPEQLRASYPEIDSFFAMKNEYDPNQRFVNTFYKKYSSQ